MTAPAPKRELTKDQAVLLIRKMRERVYPHIEIKHLADGRVAAIIGKPAPKPKRRK